MSVEEAGYERVVAFVGANNLGVEIRDFPTSTGTSAEAAYILGCSVSEIAKTIGFVCRGESETPLLIVISGDKKVDTKKLGSIIPCGKAKVMTRDELIRFTGYAPGEVPPFPHNRGVIAVVDKSVLRFFSVWGAAGSIHAVMHIPTSVFEKLNFLVVDVAERFAGGGI